jgi:hypothetical protein
MLAAPLPWYDYLRMFLFDHVYDMAFLLCFLLLAFAVAMYVSHLAWYRTHHRAIVEGSSVLATASLLLCIYVYTTEVPLQIPSDVNGASVVESLK